METINITSKAFVIRWIQLTSNQTVTYQVKPLKRSIEFGIFKKTTGQPEITDPTPAGTRRRSSTSTELPLQARMALNNLEVVSWAGMLPGNQVHTATFQAQEDGYYAFVFDNTSSKTVKKTVLFSTKTNNIISGCLLKKRRKKLQGFTKRWFKLDGDRLSYYLNEASTVVRGECVVSLSIVSAIERKRIIVVDSGVEVWELKAKNPQEWKMWVTALESCIEKDNGLSEKLGDVRDKLREIRDVYGMDMDELLRMVKVLVGGAAMSVFSEEYYDAVDEDPHLLMIQDSSSESELVLDTIPEGSSSLSLVGTATTAKTVTHVATGDGALAVSLPPAPTVPLRTEIPLCTHSPPSLLATLRKNVGKDLSSISMPVTSNEPLTLLQVMAEMFEYSHLLDESNLDPQEKLWKVMLLAVAGAANMRHKARAMRKPFTPLLGETYELVNENMAFISEKVFHRPQIFAGRVDGMNGNWSLTFSLSPESKFWGKSVELSHAGSLVLRWENEVYEWSLANLMVKNIIAGERYVEPVGQVVVQCTSIPGLTGTIEYKAGGMFSGRSEDVTGWISTPDGTTVKGLQGKWTSELSINGEVKWRASEMTPQPEKRFGFTKFAAGLNDITGLESILPATDSRLRPDLRKYENGNADEAGDLKLELEMHQRKRREAGKDAEPVWFEKKGNEWVFKNTDSSYWAQRGHFKPPTTALW